MLHIDVALKMVADKNVPKNILRRLWTIIQTFGCRGTGCYNMSACVDVCSSNAIKNDKAANLHTHAQFSGFYLPICATLSVAKERKGQILFRDWHRRIRYLYVSYSVCTNHTVLSLFGDISLRQAFINFW